MKPFWAPGRRPADAPPARTQPGPGSRDPMDAPPPEATPRSGR